MARLNASCIVSLNIIGIRLEKLSWLRIDVPRYFITISLSAAVTVCMPEREILDDISRMRSCIVPGSSSLTSSAASFGSDCATPVVERATRVVAATGSVVDATPVVAAPAGLRRFR